MSKKGLRLMKICVISSLLFIIIDLFILGMFFYNDSLTSKPSLLYEELHLTYRVFSNFELPVYLMDSHILNFKNGPRSRKTPILFGLDFTHLTTSNLSMKVNSVMNFLENLENVSFKTTIFYSNKLSPDARIKGNIPVTLIWKRFYSFQCLIFYSNQDRTWWFGSLMDDPEANDKLKYLDVVKNNVEMSFEGVLNRVEIVERFLEELRIIALTPKNPDKFLQDLKNSMFIECNSTRASNFKKKFYKNSMKGQKFKHRAWKLLARAKTILDRLAIPFWLSSGTCLGFYRECDFIPHSLDVDIGVFAKDFNNTIIPEMQLHGLKLKHWFGTVQDSLELSFIDQNELKLDIFFFYDEGDTYWNGGTQAKTGRKFKYIFQKFKLCWTIFRELKVRVPCDTHSYIVSNYGPNWFIPVFKWDWKKSPYNVQPNGLWPKSQWHNVIKVNI